MIAPIALFNENGDIIWANKKLSNELDLKDNEVQNIVSITEA